MRPRHAVLPTPSVSLRPVPLSHYLPIPFLFTLLRTLLHSPKTQPFCFQAIPHSLPKITRGGGGVLFFPNPSKRLSLLTTQRSSFLRASRTGTSLGVRLSNTPLSRRLELVAGNPARQRGQPCCLRSEHKREPGDDRIAGKIHVWAVLVTRLVITVLGEILGLLVAPLRRMARVLDPFIDRKRGHAHARQAEMVRTVIMPGLRAG